MFDSYNTKVEAVPYAQTVTVNNATTTEQARYLDELRAQARDDIFKGFLVNLDVGDVHAARFTDFFRGKDILEMTFRWEGRVLHHKVEFSHQEMMLQEPLQMLQHVKKSIAEFLAAEMMGTIATQISTGAGRLYRSP